MSHQKIIQDLIAWIDEPQITLDNDVLMVRGEKRQEQEKKEGGFHRVERSYGSFQRALRFINYL